MSAKRSTRMSNRVKAWFAKEAEHVTFEFFPDANAQPAVAGDCYLRLWLVEGFVAQRVSWGKQQFPALHGGVTLRFLGSEETPFTRFTRAGSELTSPGAFLNYPMTTLLPFEGGTVELEAALYQVSGGGPLDSVVSLAGSLASLIGPPLSTAAAVAEKVSDGIATVMEAQGQDPVLGVHWGMSSSGGGGPEVTPGHLAVVNGAPRDYAGKLHMVGGRLHDQNGLLSKVDFLVLRVECRVERDDWSFPELERLRLEAQAAFIRGDMAQFEVSRKQAMAAAVGSHDLSRTDALRVAEKARRSIDAIKSLGLVPDDEAGLDPIAAHTLLARHEVAGLTAADLLNS